MGPVRHRVSIPLRRYSANPYARSREALDALYRNGELDEWDGVKLRYVNPATGGWPMPGIATFMQYLPAGFKAAPIAAPDATVTASLKQKARSRSANDEFLFERMTLFVAPSWAPVRLWASAESVLFHYSDGPVLAALNLLREERQLDAHRFTSARPAGGSSCLLNLSSRNHYGFVFPPAAPIAVPVAGGDAQFAVCAASIV